MRLRFLSVLLLVSLQPMAAFSQVQISEDITHYTVTGSTPNEIKRQMQAKGVNGYWGYARWYVRWTGSCSVSVEVDITMPWLAQNAGASDELRAKFDQMYDALLRHERQHGQHGIDAANEIKARNCRLGNAIIDKHAQRDKDFDARTQHGYTEGVRLQ